MQTPRLFISYRRADTQAATEALRRALLEHFEADAIFVDVDSVRAGQSWPEEIDTALEQAELVIAVIGERWLRVKDANGGRRIDAPDDWVARELAAALVAGKTLIPVLVDGATMPAASALPTRLADLPRHQAVTLPPGDWAPNLSALVDRLADLGLPRHLGKFVDSAELRASVRAPVADYTAAAVEHYVHTRRDIDRLERDVMTAPNLMLAALMSVVCPPVSLFAVIATVASVTAFSRSTQRNARLLRRHPDLARSMRRGRLWGGASLAVTVGSLIAWAIVCTSVWALMAVGSGLAQ